jgi:hypothetical protein
LRKRTEWYPACFMELRDKLQSSSDPVAQGHLRGLSVSLGDNSEVKIAGLSQAASKFRLVREFQTAQFSSYHDRTAIGYSSVFRITFAVIAFEAYARMFGRNRWHQFDQEVIPHFSSSSIAAARRGFNKQQSAIVNALTEVMLQNRVNQFFDTGDSQVIALAVAFRHAFAHGKLGATPTYSASRNSLASEILTAIEKHCRNTCAMLI